MKNLIMLHGALGHIALFNPLINELKDSFNCHVLNFNGHGRQPMHDEFSIPQFTRELNDFIDDNNLEDCNVFGHSMGGYVALNASAEGNEKIKKIITLGTKFLWTKGIAQKESSLFYVEKLKIKLPSFVEQLKNQHGENWEQLVKHVKKLILNLGENPILTDEVLQMIKIPVLLCLGENDKMVTMEETLHTQSLIPNCNFISLPGQPHLLEGVEVGVLKKLILENF